MPDINNSSPSRTRHTRKLLAALTPACLWVLSACAPAVAPDPPVYVTDADRELAASAHNDIMQKFPRYEDAALERYVQGIGARLVAVAPRTNTGFHFTVLDTPGFIAYSYANGEVVVSRGYLAHLNTEAQLAALLAHEIGHVVSLHLARQMQAARNAQRLEQQLATRLSSSQARETLNTFSVARVRGYSREQELEADAWGDRLLLRAGYDPAALAQLLQFFLQLDGFYDQVGFEMWDIPESGGGRGVFASHPSSELRLQRVLERLPRTARTRVDAEPAYLNALQGMVFGLAERHGVQRGFQYIHPAQRVAFSLPAEWYVFGESGRIVAASRTMDGILIIRTAQPAAGVSQHAALAQLAQDHALASSTTIARPGVSGMTGLVHVDTGAGKQTVRLAVMDIGGRRLLCTGLTFDPGNWTAADQRFLKILHTLRPVTETEAAKAQPLRVQSMPVGGGKEPTAYLYALTDHAQQRWQLLNQRFPAGRASGQQVKVVR
jgi:predicted Zn-dependent protease